MEPSKDIATENHPHYNDVLPALSPARCSFPPLCALPTSPHSPPRCALPSLPRSPLLPAPSPPRCALPSSPRSPLLAVRSPPRRAPVLAEPSSPRHALLLAVLSFSRRALPSSPYSPLLVAPSLLIEPSGPFLPCCALPYSPRSTLLAELSRR